MISPERRYEIRKRTAASARQLLEHSTEVHDPDPTLSEEEAAYADKYMHALAKKIGNASVFIDDADLSE